MKKAAVQNPDGRVMARLFARDLNEVISASETQNLGTTPSSADTTVSEAATSERTYES
jgi:hypothetical protein